MKKSKYSNYQICVMIIEARHLQQLANPMVVVKLGNQKRRTVVREGTDCPVYNEYFVFDFAGNFETLLSTRITIAVYLRNYLRQLKFYGSSIFEVEAVWEQPDHQYHHKWAMLTDPKSLSSEPKGYVKCNVAVRIKGGKVRVYPDTEGEDDIEGNLLLPIGGEALPFGQRARYIFTIYRADGLPDMTSICGFGDTGGINPYVQISFAGMKGTTRVLWRTCTPRFNERIIFSETFPSFCRRIRITMKHRVNSCRTRTLATRVIHIGQISNSGEYGFLPTYGPSFLHFYASNKEERNSCCFSSSLPFYRGRVLLSLKTEMDDPETSPRIGIETEPAAPIIEKSLWKVEEYVLLGILYDVCMIDRSRFAKKSIVFELSIGNAGNQRFSRDRCDPGNNNDDYDEDNDDNDNDDDKNIQGFLLEKKLEEVETLVAVENPKACKTYNETIRRFKSHCLHYLHTLDDGRYDAEGDGGGGGGGGGRGTIKLDRHRANVCCKQIDDILRRIKIDGEIPNNHFIGIAMIHAYQYLRELRGLCEDVNGLPHVYLWMLAGSKRVAYVKIPAERIIYSEDNAERGEKCGQSINVFLKNPAKEMEFGETIDQCACKIEIFLWLGNAKFVASCWSSIPPGYVISDHEETIDAFPKYFEYDRSSTFQLRAHIFQGRFEPGMDTSALLDPFVRVTFSGYTLTTSVSERESFKIVATLMPTSVATKVIRQSLDPLWDESLIFPRVKIHGTREHIKIMPPKVVLQVFDQDICGMKEFCGRCIAVPLVKLSTETYSPPDFQPKLGWYRFQSGKNYTGSILAALELIETEETDMVDVLLDERTQEEIKNIPSEIRPKMTSYRLEVIFWGVRDMRKLHWVPVYRPRIVIECAGVVIKSRVMENAKKFSNFEEPRVMVDLEMPELDEYYPCVTIRAYDSRGFGCFKYAGICIIPTVNVFLEQLITDEDYQAQIYQTKSARKFGRGVAIPTAATSIKRRPYVLSLDSTVQDERKGLMEYKKTSYKRFPRKTFNIFEYVKKLFKWRKLIKKRRKEDYGTEMHDDSLDWWSKYFASLEIYSEELETQPEFDGFQDRLTTFELWKGKRIENLDDGIEGLVGKFKGHISVYRWPHPENLSCKTRHGRNAANGLCDDYPSQESVKLLVRVYVIKGIHLHPKDPLGGKSDPYLCVKLGKIFINDRKNHIPNQLNPTFGRVFEMDATFPRDYMLSIQVWDHDATTTDDLIGETKIDIENRFYSRHRANCGLARTYETFGYNAWRDREKPTQILDFLCKKNNLPIPVYDREEVRIGKRKFPFRSIVNNETDREECMALNVLHQWQEFPICGCALVPEHIERRPLFNATRPGLEQGRLEIWIDMFPIGNLPPKPAVNISPLVPEEYEIRVIVWNTEDVPLVESQFLTGEMSSDIYVKGWILPEDRQKTDVHYNSLSGEGNFNWRFVFRLVYSKSENVMIVRKKLFVFARNETEEKLPCKLHLEVWDSDHFSADDFLGALTLNLSKMPRGSANSKTCTMKILDSKLPTVNLFKISRLKAWWPLVRRTEDAKYVQAGKIEMELSTLRGVEANERPVGKGRDPPEELPPPKRPDTSFSWFFNPWRACRHVVCRYYKWRILLCVLCVLFVILICCAIYAFPGYFVKRLLGA
ncbi:hypothetical protein M0804_008605 [Polistes exclamans]|nr:hypothetical protein M0804_008605 [Polistes exclamans]